MAETLKAYWDKRDFQRTPEPKGEHVASGEDVARYVMHMHAASHDHFDLRLEQNGVLRSWALPKGPSLTPGEKRLAVEVEDHPLAYGDFEGVIPQKEYGGGTVMLWDTGTWVRHGPEREDRIDLELRGTKLEGRWSLVRTSPKGDNGRRKARQWLFIKRRDRGNRRLDPDDLSVLSGRSMDEIAADRHRVWSSHEVESPLDPSTLAGARKGTLMDQPAPQLAVLESQPPEGEQWLHEIKFDGYRIMARLDAGEVTLLTRNGHDWTHRFPSLVGALERLPVENAIIDGEIVVFESDGTTSFRKLQERIGKYGNNKVTDKGLVLQVFDLLYLDGYRLERTPLNERKSALKRILEVRPRLADDPVRYSDHIQGLGPGFLQEVCEMGLEGIISKQADAHYRAGRNGAWVKSKCSSQDEFVIGGYTEPSGSRVGFGSLLLGAYGASGFEYQGRVGAGFSSRQIDSLYRRLKALATDTRPFVDAVPDSKGASWVQPQIVVDVEFTQRSARGVLRHPVFRGLREDKSAEEIATEGNQSDEDEADTEQQAAPPVAPAKSRPATGRKTRGVKIAGVPVSHADRVLFPEVDVTKRDLADYMAATAEWMLPHIARRPLALVRCPEGWVGDCFFQKNPGRTLAGHVPQVTIPRNSGGESDFVYVEEARDLVYLVQFGVIELHPWGSRIDHVEQPDTITFDFDPDPGLEWSVLVSAARRLNELLQQAGLTGFPRTTGGKGLHVVVPIVPEADWDTIKQFARVVSSILARERPKVLTTNMSKSRRKGRIFLDYLRNGRGATSVASYSVRAREGAPVATPLRWNEVSRVGRGDRYTMANLPRRLSSLTADPWAEFEQCRRSLTVQTLEKLEANP